MISLKVCDLSCVIGHGNRYFTKQFIGYHDNNISTLCCYWYGEVLTGVKWCKYQRQWKWVNDYKHDFFAAILSGPLTNRFGPKVVIFVGAVTTCAGYITSALPSHFTVLFLTYGVISGKSLFQSSFLLCFLFFLPTNN